MQRGAEQRRRTISRPPKDLKHRHGDGLALGTIERRLEEMRQLAGERGRVNEALALAASLDQELEKAGRHDRAMWQLAKRKRLKPHRRESLIVCLIFPDRKSNLGRFAQVLRLARALGLHGKTLVKQLKRGGVDAFVKLEIARRRKEQDE